MDIDLDDGTKDANVTAATNLGIICGLMIRNQVMLNNNNEQKGAKI